MHPSALQTETFDAEMEGLASNVKKNKKLPVRHGHLDESISRHKQHITRLEQMLRLLDNEVRDHCSRGWIADLPGSLQHESGRYLCAGQGSGRWRAGLRIYEDACFPRID